MDVTATNRSPDNSLIAIHDPIIEDIDIMVTQNKPIIESNGKLKSTLDFPGVTMVITEGANQLEVLDLFQFSVKVKSGQSVTSYGPFERVMHKEQVAYRYVFPAQGKDNQ